MHSIISVVGKSGSGKTSLLENLIAELKERGHRVAMVKHSHHADDFDTADKDTWRFSRAGSTLSAINSLDNLAIYRRMDHHFDPAEISSHILWDFDLILTEGFKSSNYPKIEVHRREQGPDLVTDPESLLAVVTDEPLELDVPQFSDNEVGKIADLIEKTMERRLEDDIDVIVNGSQVRISPALGEVLARTFMAMIPSVPENAEIKSLHVSLRRKN